jgi:glycosyltransferase involved in cell wall biosynthesis
MNRLRSAKLDMSIVLPCYNPKPGWHLELGYRYDEIRNHLPAGTVIELIIVNDGSTAPLSAASKKFLSRRCQFFKFISYAQNRGKGYALRRGIEAARSPYIIYTDIDFPYTVAAICNMYYCLKNNYAEVVMGVREDSYNQQLSPLRRIASGTCNFLNRVILKLPYRDVQSGLKGMNAIGRELFLKTTIDSFLFDTEFIWMTTAYSNIRLQAIPIALRDDISFTNMSSAVYIREAGNFCRILIKNTSSLIRRFDAAFTSAISNTIKLRPGRV